MWGPGRAGAPSPWDTWKSQGPGTGIHAPGTSGPTGPAGRLHFARGHHGRCVTEVSAQLSSRAAGSLWSATAHLSGCPVPGGLFLTHPGARRTLPSARTSIKWVLTAAREPSGSSPTQGKPPPVTPTLGHPPSDELSNVNPAASLLGTCSRPGAMFPGPHAEAAVMGSPCGRSPHSSPGPLRAPPDVHSGGQGCVLPRG